MKVLIVDDHAVVRRGSRELLAEAFPEAEFEEAETGEHAIGMVEHMTLDLVILDISMPRRGGLDALKEIEARKPAEKRYEIESRSSVTGAFRIWTLSLIHI